MTDPMGDEPSNPVTLQPSLVPTPMRMNKVYYFTYFLFLQMTLATIIPIGSLAYLSIATLRGLKTIRASLKTSVPLRASSRMAASGPAASFRNNYRRSTRNININISSVDNHPNTDTVDENGCLVIARDESAAPLEHAQLTRGHSLSPTSSLRSARLSETRPPRSPRSSGNVRSKHFSLLVTSSKANNNVTLQHQSLSTPVPTVSRSASAVSATCSIPSNYGERNVSEPSAEEKRLTRIAIVLVGTYIFCHMWKLLPSIYEAWYCVSQETTEVKNWPEWLANINSLSHLVIVANSAFNFLLYLCL